MKQQILSELDKIEQDHQVRILLAVESGSRAWGFPSTDSDYDVRFVYVHPPHWYLTIGEKRDVLELPLDAVLDINGWDLKKSLQLLRKSNVPLFEWLASPIHYRIGPEVYEQLMPLSRKAFRPETAFHHYLSMAKKSFETIEAGEQVRLKTYLYALRPLFCCEWISRKATPPPMAIEELLAESAAQTAIKEEIRALIEVKNRHPEKHTVDSLESIENFIREQIETLPGHQPEKSQKLDLDAFDEVFRAILQTSES